MTDNMINKIIRRKSQPIVMCHGSVQQLSTNIANSHRPDRVHHGALRDHDSHPLLRPGEYAHSTTRSHDPFKFRQG